jgi:hypothetical protein
MPKLEFFYLSFIGFIFAVNVYVSWRLCMKDMGSWLHVSFICIVLWHNELHMNDSYVSHKCFICNDMYINDLK